MIDIDTLTESDRGREVRYRAYQVIEYGRITSWNKAFIHVRYHTKIEPNGKTTARVGETSEATSPQDLEFT